MSQVTVTQNTQHATVARFGVAYSVPLHGLNRTSKAVAKFSFQLLVGVELMISLKKALC